MKNKSIKQLFITQDDPITSYISDTSEIIKSVSFDDNTITTLTFENIPNHFIGYDKTNNLVLNNKYFSDLKKTDATQSSQKSIIGTYIQSSDHSYTPKDIILFLLHSHIISTYWHISSEISLINEYTDNNIYHAQFDASHEYCTNICQTEEYTFDIEFDKNTGTILLHTQ